MPAGAQAATVSRIVDGDTIWVNVDEAGGPLGAQAEHKIRLLEDDAPEDTSTTECGGAEATAALRRGWGQAVVYQPNDRHIDTPRRAENRARQAGQGIWRPPCDLDAPPPPPEPEAEQPPASSSQPRCDPSYQGACIAPHPPDLDCGEVDATNFDSVGSDPHGFDGDNDGIACEASRPAPEQQPRPAPPGNCDPNYQGACIAPHPPDLDCGEVSEEDFRSVGSDPHGFDGDNDGLACES